MIFMGSLLPPPPPLPSLAIANLPHSMYTGSNVKPPSLCSFLHNQYQSNMISFKDNGDKWEHYIFLEEPGKPEIETSYPRGTVPTKVLAFVVVPDAQNRDDCPNDNSPNNIRAIVHCAKYQDCTDAKEGSILTETWKMEYHLLRQSVNIFIELANTQGIDDDQL
jgi:hypothetical protein